VQEQAQAGAGKGDRDMLRVGKGRVSAQLVKQSVGRIWNAVPWPCQIIWLDSC